MNAQDMRSLIDGLTQDIDFEYRGKRGAICPFSHTDISLCYDGMEISVDSVDKAMNTPFVLDQTLADMCTELEI